MKNDTNLGSKNPIPVIESNEKNLDEKKNESLSKSSPNFFEMLKLKNNENASTEKPKADGSSNQEKTIGKVEFEEKNKSIQNFKDFPDEVMVPKQSTNIEPKSNTNSNRNQRVEVVPAKRPSRKSILSKKNIYSGKILNKTPYKSKLKEMVMKVKIG